MRVPFSLRCSEGFSALHQNKHKTNVVFARVRIALSLPLQAGWRMMPLEHLAGRKIIRLLMGETT
jgi:hypothetical protein